MEIDGEKVRSERYRHAWTQRELGQRAGLTFSTICRIEKGRQNPHPTTVRKLAVVLGVAPEDLLKSQPGNHAPPIPAAVARTKTDKGTGDFPIQVPPIHVASSTFP
jgi:transcriptional regulator with XRE-family HTH domain